MQSFSGPGYMFVWSNTAPGCTMHIQWPLPCVFTAVAVRPMAVHVLRRRRFSPNMNKSTIQAAARQHSDSRYTLKSGNKISQNLYLIRLQLQLNLCILCEDMWKFKCNIS